VSLSEDLLAEGEPEREFNSGIASRLPRKRVGAGVLFRDSDGRLMMVETASRLSTRALASCVRSSVSSRRSAICWWWTGFRRTGRGPTG